MKAAEQLPGSFLFPSFFFLLQQQLFFSRYAISGDETDCDIHLEKMKGAGEASLSSPSFLPTFSFFFSLPFFSFHGPSRGPSEEYLYVNHNKVLVVREMMIEGPLKGVNTRSLLLFPFSLSSLIASSFFLSFSSSSSASRSSKRIDLHFLLLAAMSLLFLLFLPRSCSAAVRII